MTECRAERAAHIDVALPYELRALEGALHVAVAALEEDTLQLEHSIGASLDNLDRRVQFPLMSRPPLCPSPPQSASACSIVTSDGKLATVTIVVFGPIPEMLECAYTVLHFYLNEQKRNICCRTAASYTYLQYLGIGSIRQY